MPVQHLQKQLQPSVAVLAKPSEVSSKILGGEEPVTPNKIIIRSGSSSPIGQSTFSALASSRSRLTPSQASTFQPAVHPRTNQQSSNIHICEAKEVSPPISPYIDFRCKQQPHDFSVHAYQLTNERNKSSFQTHESLQPLADTSQNTPNTFRTVASLSRATPPLLRPDAHVEKEAELSAEECLAMKQKIAELRELNELKDLQALTLHKDNKRLQESEDQLKQQLKEAQSQISQISLEVQDKIKMIESLQQEIMGLASSSQSNKVSSAQTDLAKPSGCEEQNCTHQSLSLFLQRPAGGAVCFNPRPNCIS